MSVFRLTLCPKVASKIQDITFRETKKKKKDGEKYNVRV
jgi:hypothetical protein